MIWGGDADEAQSHYGFALFFNGLDEYIDLVADQRLPERVKYPLQNCYRSGASPFSQVAKPGDHKTLYADIEELQAVRNARAAGGAGREGPALCV